ncbi:MAG: hypothetical protein J3R72DRAFT_443705 [Linnemannia gamsii]|nr:MAG: hypothetical protein J3R72DRAFT_443705 [Linnemannia gamsii]
MPVRPAGSLCFSLPLMHLLACAHSSPFFVFSLRYWAGQVGLSWWIGLSPMAFSGECFYLLNTQSQQRAFS